MRRPKIIDCLFAVAIALSGLTGCAQLAEVRKVAESTVPASVVVPAANTFNILKAGATRYGQFCIQQKFVPAICSAEIRRAVVKAVKVGTGARDRMTVSIESGTPAAASVFNLMVGAIDDLKATPAASAQFQGATP